MSRIIKRREHHEETEYYKPFWYVDHIGGCGFTFPCDEFGNVKETDANHVNYQGCVAGSVNGHAVVESPVEKRTHHYTTPAELRCDCGEIVYLDGFTNTCDRCDRDYNMSGQLLASRSQWGEETGEALADILRIR